MESYRRERITNRYRTNALFSFKLANKRQFCRWRERVFYLYTRVYVCTRICAYICRASRTGYASYTLNSVRMSPNGEIVINLSVKIQTRPGFPNNLLRTRGGTRCDTPTLSLSTRFTDSRQPSQPSVRPRPRAALNRIRSSMPFLSAERTSNGDENATIEKRNYIKIGRRESSSLEQVCVENSPGKDIFLSDTRRRFRGRRGRRRSYSVNNSRGNSNRAVAISRGGRKKQRLRGEHARTTQHSHFSNEPQSFDPSSKKFHRNFSSFRC